MTSATPDCELHTDKPSLSITSTAFACAIAICALVTFFAQQQQDIDLNWSGNNISFEGVDAAGPILKTLADGEYFGPGPGQF